jgi:hypothetical protein
VLLLKNRKNFSGAIQKHKEDGDVYLSYLDFDMEVLREVYPSLLKRLDDSVDEIRIRSGEAFATLFAILESLITPSGNYRHRRQSVPSFFQYVVSALSVHVDDLNREVKAAMKFALKAAKKV